HTISKRDWSSDVCSSDLPFGLRGGSTPCCCPLTAPPAFAGRQSRGDSKECCRPASRKGEHKRAEQRRGHQPPGASHVHAPLCSRSEERRVGTDPRLRSGA